MVKLSNTIDTLATFLVLRKFPYVKRPEEVHSSTAKLKFEMRSVRKSVREEISIPKPTKKKMGPIQKQQQRQLQIFRPKWWLPME
jgi:hypothetical protein